MRSLDGQLQKMPFGEIFQTISLCKQTGVLTLTDSNAATSKLVFSQGKLFYASLDSVGPFGQVLMKKGIVTSAELETALTLQRDGEKNTLLADILEKTGIVSKDVLEVELKRHLVAIVRTLLGWEAGSFHFDFGLRLEKPLLLENGLNLPSLLIEATRPVDSWRSDLQTDITTETPAEREEWALFTSMASELLGTMSTNEVLLLFFRYASEVLNRCVIFVAKRKELVGMGQSGLQFRGDDADDRIKKVRIPLLEPSLFREVIDRSGSYRGPLAEGQAHQNFISQIGEGIPLAGRVASLDWPSEIFMAPLFDGKNTVAFLYGDNLPSQTPLSDTRGLEAFVKIAGVAYAKAALEKKLADRKGVGITPPSE